MSTFDSFSSGVKNELSQQVGKARHCQVSELSAILSLCPHASAGQRGFSVSSEQHAVCEKVYLLMQHLFHVSGEVTCRRGRNGSSVHRCQVMYRGTSLLKAVLKETRLTVREGRFQENEVEQTQGLYQRTCCRRSYIRGAFLSCGSVNDPQRNYHIEFLSARRSSAERIRQFLLEYDIECRILDRTRSRRQAPARVTYVVYLKNAEQLSDVLGVMGASKSLLDLENIRVEKDMKNRVQRQVNCETANLHKTVSTAVRQIKAIEYLQQHGLFSQLQDELQQIALARQENPELTLQQLGALMDPPVSKSGANHRLMKLVSIAEDHQKTVPEDTE